MISRELKHFHNENRTHVTKKEYAGAEITAENAVNAPMDLKIYGASEQTADYVMCEGGSKQNVTEQGKNLFDKSLPIEQVSVTGDGIVRYGFKIKVGSGTYTVSGGLSNCFCKTLIDSVYGEYHLLENPVTLVLENSGYILLYAVTVSELSQSINTLQIEEGTTPTDYEAFVPDSPSPDYPSEITPLVAAGTYKIGTKDGSYLITLPNMYSAGGACDKLMFDKISKTARLKQEIDPELLDPAKTIEENTQAVLAEPVYTGLTVTKTGWAADNAEVPWKIYGKNLFSTERHVRTSLLKYTYISNSSFKLEGSNTSLSDLPTASFSLNLPAGTYRLSFKATFRNSVSTNFTPNFLIIRKNSFSGTTLLSTGMGNNQESKNRSYAFTLEEDCPKLFIVFYAYLNPTSCTDYFMQIEDIQLEKASTATDFEAYNATPPESLTPSVDYPHKIYTSREMTLKCTGGVTVNSTKIPLMGNAMEVSDIAQSNLVLDGKYYLSDYIEYNSAADKALRYKFIDNTLLDYTLPIKDQTQAILAKPTVEKITAGNGEYSFKDVKSVQDGCTLTTESYSKDKLPHPKPMYIEAKVKVIKG